MLRKKSIINIRMIVFLFLLVRVEYAQPQRSRSQDTGFARFNIMDFGAVPDGKTLNTEAIQKTINTALQNGGGIVYVPPGVYLSGSLELFDNITLYLEGGATIKGSRLYEHYDKGHLIIAREAKNVCITGSGQIDGQGDAFWERRDEFPEWIQERKSYGWVPAFCFKRKKRPESLISFIGCSDIRMENVLLQNSPAWTVHFLACDFVNVRGLHIRNLIHGCNTDGLDFDACRDVLVSDCDIITGDDAIVLKNTNRENRKRLSRNITVTNCILATTCNGFKIGTETQDDFENIVFTNSIIKAIEDYDLQSDLAPDKLCIEQPTDMGPLSGIALESIDGGHVRGIMISNLVMKGVRAPIFLRIGNRGRGQKAETTIPGTLSNITIDNIIAYDASITSSITGLINYPVEDVSISNVRIEVNGGGSKELAERKIKEEEKKGPDSIMFGPLPAFGFFCRHVHDLTMRNISVTFKNNDARPVLVCDDVSDLCVEGLKANSQIEAHSLIRLVNVSDAIFQGMTVPKGLQTWVDVRGMSSKHILLLPIELIDVQKPYTLGKDVSQDVVKMVKN